MRTYAAYRGAGKTVMCINRAAQSVRDGIEVYYISPNKQMSDYNKKFAEKIVGKETASKIHFLTADRVFDKAGLTGINKRKSSKVIFDDLDHTLNAIVKSKFGAYSEVDLVTSTEEDVKKK